MAFLFSTAMTSLEQLAGSSLLFSISGIVHKVAEDGTVYGIDGSYIG